MFEVLKEKDCVKVTVKLNKRVLAKEPKVYIYSRDALEEAKKHFPDVKIAEHPQKNFVASNVRMPHEVTWKFALLSNKEETQKEVQTHTHLTKAKKGATVVETAESQELEIVQDPTE